MGLKTGKRKGTGKKRVLMLGTYLLDTYGRGKVLQEGLKANGYEVEVYSPHGLLKYAKLKWRLLRRDYDAIIATGHKVFLLSRLLAFGKPVLFDIFISAYDTIVLDRKLVKPGSLKARYIWLADKWMCRLAEQILTINDAYSDFFVKEFGIPREKLHAVVVGADEKLFRPRKSLPHEGFLVEFHGSFIPLHGIGYVIDAAKELQDSQREKDITFLIAGKGQMFDAMQERVKKEKLSNVKLLGHVPWDTLVQNVADADVYLGICGTTPKSARCITHKVFEDMRMGKPIITLSSPATRSIFTHSKDVWLVKPGDGKALAKAVLHLKNYPELRKRLGENAHRLYEERYSVKKLGEKVKDVLEMMSRKRR